MGRPTKSDLPPKLSKTLQQIGINIRFLRDKKGLSQSELARLAKISATTINEIESKRLRDIRLSTLTSISQVLGISVVELLAESDLELSARDKTQLLQASEAILRITKKLED